VLADILSNTIKQPANKTANTQDAINTLSTGVVKIENLKTPPTTQEDLNKILEFQSITSLQPSTQLTTQSTSTHMTHPNSPPQ
jgi:hypothetical protein